MTEPRTPTLVPPLPSRTRTRSPKATPVREAPPAPEGLGPAGRTAWTAVMSFAPLLLEHLDEVTVLRLCQALDEREALRAQLQAGYMLEEPIVSPPGKVVGERLVINPAIPALRALDRSLDALAAALAITPKSRADLGLTLSDAELKQMNIDELMRRAYTKETRP